MSEVSHPKDVLHTVNLVTQCLCIPIVTLFVGLRFYTRLRFKQPLGVEDYPCTIAWASPIHGILWSQHCQFCYIATILYCPMVLFVKIALLSIITRIFAPYRAKVMFIYVLLGCLGVYYVIALIIKIRMCDPIPTYWTGVGGKCLDQNAALIADSVISVVSDFIILVLPLPLTWSLQMSRNRKLRVMGLLGADGLATAFSLYRLVLVLTGNPVDMSIFFVIVILSGNAEGGIGLICACLPIISVLLAYHKKKYSSQKYYNQHSTNVHLSDGKSSPTSKAASEWDKSVAFGDQSHLISFVGTPEAAESVCTEDGIRKTVAVSRTIEAH
ncbi:hypothetical protein N7524_011895 [Penicillium chrysogenum]|nr:hypothetical protein N7524_011895 [Penicillium chrysogenum]